MDEGRESGDGRVQGERAGMDCIPYSGGEIRYEIVRGRRKRTVAIRLDSASAVTVFAPRRLGEESIRTIVRKKAPWILRRQAKIRESGETHPPKQYVSGEVFPYLGRRYRLEVSPLSREGEPVCRHGQGRLDISSLSREGAPICRLKQGRFRVEIPKGLDGDKGRAAVKQAVREWYMRRAEETIRKRLPRFAEKLGVKAAGIEIRDQKGRWGSCSRTGILRFNWRIVAAFPDLLDYLIVHELSHLLHPDHSPRFWQEVRCLIPECDRMRAQLREHGPVAAQLG